MTMEQWAAAMGFVLPALVAIVNREEWSPWIKGLVAILASVVTGTVTALVNGELTGVNWASAIGIVFISSQAAYLTWWKNTKIGPWIEQNVNVIPEKTEPEPVGPFFPESDNESDDGPTPVLVPRPKAGRHARVEE